MSSLLPPPPEFGAALPIESSPEVLRFLALRRSAPALTLAEPGPDPAQLEDLLRLAARTPDHGKLSPWRFIVLDGEAKAIFTQRLEALAVSRGDQQQAAKLGKLKVPPLAVFVISSPRPGVTIPEWEQVLSSAVATTNLLYAALAMGFGANWITDWYSYDAEATAILGLQPTERVAGCVLIGAAREAPLERERPVVKPLVTHWLP